MVPNHPESSTHETAFVRRAAESPVGTTSLPMSTEARGDLGRRLGTLALTYAGAYTAVHATNLIRMFARGLGESLFLPNLVAGLSISLAILVFVMTRRGSLSARALANLTLAFQIAGAIGIMASSWGWEQHFDQYQRHVWDALGIVGTFPQDFVQRMVPENMRIVYIEGVSWVGVWVLTVPILVPMGSRAAFLGIALTVLTVPLVLCLSPLVHGIPPR